MITMNMSLPEALESFVDAQVSTCGYSTSIEYVRELIRKDQDRLSLRGLLLGGAPVTCSWLRLAGSRKMQANARLDRTRGDASVTNSRLRTVRGRARYPVTALFPEPVSPKEGRARERPTRRLASRIESSSVAPSTAIAPLG